MKPPRCAPVLVALALTGSVTSPMRGQLDAGISSDNPNRIVSAKIAENGRVQIRLKSGKYVQAAAEKDQTACKPVKVAANGGLAGWLVAYGNYGASYPIPTSLIVYRVGKPFRRFGNGFMLNDWSFVDHDKHVQFSSSQTHGTGANWQTVDIWDIDTGRLLKRWREPSDDDVRRDAILTPVSGQVADARGRPVSDVFVTVRAHPMAEAIAATTTDEAGRLSISNIQPGHYELRFEHRGFKQRVVGITVGKSGKKVEIGTVTLEVQPATRK